MTTSKRVVWVDAAKGIGILLMVFGHVWRGLNEADLIRDPLTFEVVDRAIYLFHMPLFFFLSGLFFTSASMRGWMHRIEALLYPMVLWSYLTAAFRMVVGGLTNRPPITLAEAALAPFPPKDIYWFLWALLLIQLTAGLACHISKRYRAFPAIVALMACIFVILFGVELPEAIAPAVANAPYFAAGVYFSTRGRLQHSGAMLAFLGAAAFICAEAMNLASATRATGASDLLLTIAAVGGFCLVISWATTISGAKFIWTPLIILGQLTMPIFLAHVFVQAAVRITLIKLGVTSLPVQLLFGTSAAVIAPIIMYIAVERLRCSRILGLPRGAISTGVRNTNRSARITPSPSQ